MNLTYDQLESELRRVEKAIARLTASDAFIEDLVVHHAYRKALIAALSNRPRKRRTSLIDFGWDFDRLRNTPARMVKETDRDAEDRWGLDNGCRSKLLHRAPR